MLYLRSMPLLQATLVLLMLFAVAALPSSAAPMKAPAGAPDASVLQPLQHHARSTPPPNAPAMDDATAAVVSTSLSRLQQLSGNAAAPKQQRDSATKAKAAPSASSSRPSKATSKAKARARANKAQAQAETKARKAEARKTKLDAEVQAIAKAKAEAKAKAKAKEAKKANAKPKAKSAGGVQAARNRAKSIQKVHERAQKVRELMASKAPLRRQSKAEFYQVGLGDKRVPLVDSDWISLKDRYQLESLELAKSKASSKKRRTNLRTDARRMREEGVAAVGMSEATVTSDLLRTTTNPLLRALADSLSHLDKAGVVQSEADRRMLAELQQEALIQDAKSFTKA